MRCYWAVLLACSAVYLSIPLNSAAQEALSLQQALDEAQRQNPDLRTERLRLNEVRSRRTLAGLLLPFNPEFGFEETSDRRFANQGEGGYSVSLSQEFEVAGQRGKRKWIADLALEQVQAGVERSEQVLAAEVKTAYHRLALAREKLMVADSIMAIDERLAAVAAQRYQAGDISELEFNLVAAERDQTAAQRFNLEAEARAAETELNLLLGRPAAQPIAVRVDTTYAPLDLDLEQVQDLGLEVRPDLQALRLEEQATARGIRLALAEAIPNPKLSLSYARERAVFAADNFIGNPGAIRGLRDTDRLLRVQVGLPLPLLNHNQAGVQKARAENQLAVARRESLAQHIRAETASAYSQFVGTRQALEAYRNLLPRVEQNASLLVKAYETGELDLSGLLLQTDRIFRMRLAYFDALIAYRQALARLEQALGRPLPPATPRR